MPGDPGVTVVTMLVCYFYFAREAAGALMRPAFPAPSDFQKAGRSRQNPGATHAAGSRTSNFRGCLKN
jgi:hypothetical protein